MNRLRFLPLFFFFISLIPGLYLGSLLTPLRESAASSAIPHPMIVLANEQRNILIISVDRLQSARYQLRGIWEAIYAPNYPSITWVPIYPAVLGSDPSKNEELLRTFRLTPELHLDPSFVRYLHQRNFQWSGYLILDEVAIFEILQAFNINSVVDLSPTNQIKSIQSFCNSVTRLDKQPSLLDLYNRLSGHMVTDIRADEAFAEWQILLNHGGERFCEFPTLTLNQNP